MAGKVGERKVQVWDLGQGRLCGDSQQLHLLGHLLCAWSMLAAEVCHLFYSSDGL